MLYSMQKFFVVTHILIMRVNKIKIASARKKQ